MKNRVFPKTFGSGRVGYSLPNGYGLPYLGIRVSNGSGFFLLGPCA